MLRSLINSTCFLSLEFSVHFSNVGNQEPGLLYLHNPEVGGACLITMVRPHGASMFLKEDFLCIFSERRGHADPCRATRGSTRFGQEAEAGMVQGWEAGGA